MMIKFILKLLFTVIFYFSTSKIFLRLIHSQNFFRRSQNLSFIEYSFYLIYFILLMYLAHRVTESFFMKSFPSKIVVTNSTENVKKVSVTILEEKEEPKNTQSQLMEVLQDIEPSIKKDQQP